jgi:hypothetical protein
MTYNGRGVFKNPYSFIPSEKSLYKVRTDKSGASCNQVHFKPPMWGRPCGVAKMASRLGKPFTRDSIKLLIMALLIEKGKLLRVE